jgi:hypothetical protein
MATPYVKAWTKMYRLAYTKLQICGRLVDGFYINSTQFSRLLMTASTLNIINDIKSNKLTFNLTSILSDISSYCLSCHGLEFYARCIAITLTVKPM